jgi:hypothetical protein
MKIGVTDPHVPQNDRVPPEAVVYFSMLSLPATHRNPASGALTYVAKGAP